MESLLIISTRTFTQLTNFLFKHKPQVKLSTLNKQFFPPTTVTLLNRLQHNAPVPKKKALSIACIQTTLQILMHCERETMHCIWFAISRYTRFLGGTTQKAVHGGGAQESNHNICCFGASFEKLFPGKVRSEKIDKIRRELLLVYIGLFVMAREFLSVLTWTVMMSGLVYTVFPLDDVTI